MRAVITPHRFSRSLRVPASKSHTIRRLLIASMSDGISEIDYPLDALDARSCVSVCRSLGAEIEEIRRPDAFCANPEDERGEKLVRWRVKGCGGALSPAAGRSKASQPSDLGVPAELCPQNPTDSWILGTELDAGNSGTTLFFALAMAALGTEPLCFTGDKQTGRRSAAPLLNALTGLGVSVRSGRNGCIPISIQGPWKGGRVSLPCPTSQYLSALLLAAPLAPAGTVTEIDVPLLNERPYIEMTLSYLDSLGIAYDREDDFSYFRIPGGASYAPINGPVPGDFSSAALSACAAAVSGGETALFGLDPEDTQGDKEVFNLLKKMGCEVRWNEVPRETGDQEGGTELQGREWKLELSMNGPLKAVEADLNATPDILPVMAASACYAKGETGLVNIAHARIKETDRIAVMAAELRKLGAVVEELSDGLVIQGRSGSGIPPLRGGKVHGHGDHRVVMALAAAALGADGPVEIDTAESAAVTYPGFLEQLEANILE
ncbi:3-phosphoshikimate 1-carboxyvinyltransferase [Treponema sp. OttesenSCG-928-L16]|nr:3-phosphoshikimate 1-carboxyvinyltransferase [Treponema sp. OttesenSCG-928-L16]